LFCRNSTTLQANRKRCLSACDLAPGLPQQNNTLVPVDAYFRMPWPTAFMPVTIVLSSRNAAAMPAEYLAVYERKIPAQSISI